MIDKDKKEKMKIKKKNQIRKKTKVSQIPCFLDLFQHYKTNMLVVKLIVSYAEKLH